MAKQTTIKAGELAQGVVVTEAARNVANEVHKAYEAQQRAASALEKRAASAFGATVGAILAGVTTLERIDTRTADNETPPGTTSLAKPRPPLDRAPGQPVVGN